MGFQWGWNKRLPRTIGKGGMVLLGIFAVLFGWPLLLLILGYVYVIVEFISGLFHSG